MGLNLVRYLKVISVWSLNMHLKIKYCRLWCIYVSMSLMSGCFHLSLRWFYQVVLHRATEALCAHSLHAYPTWCLGQTTLSESSDDLENAALPHHNRALGTLIIPAIDWHFITTLDAKTISSLCLALKILDDVPSIPNMLPGWPWHYWKY